MMLTSKSNQSYFIQTPPPEKNTKKDKDKNKVCDFSTAVLSSPRLGVEKVDGWIDPLLGVQR